MGHGLLFFFTLVASFLLKVIYVSCTLWDMVCYFFYLVGWLYVQKLSDVNSKFTFLFSEK